MKRGFLLKKRGLKKAVFCVCFTMSMMMFSTSVMAQTILYTSSSDKEKEEGFKYYEGKVTAGVNVRVGAGTDKEKVKVNGNGVTLTEGKKVLIIGTKKVGNKPWYKIRFTYDGQEVEGYATSSYISKTGEVITPTPLPTPTIEPTIEPTKAPEPTIALNGEETSNQDVEAKKAATQNGNKPMVYFGIVLVTAAIGGGIYYALRKRDEYRGVKENQVSEKVARLKDIVIGTREENKEARKNSTSNMEKKKPEVRVSKGDKVIRQADLITSKSDVYVINSNEIEAEEELELSTTLEESTFEDDNEYEQDISLLQQESIEKKELRIAINNLREHDIIIHKYFGKGEVYDNSDVRLIEVRFGGDTRFMNKEQLVNKKLIQVTNEKNR